MPAIRKTDSYTLRAATPMRLRLCLDSLGLWLRSGGLLGASCFLRASSLRRVSARYLNARLNWEKEGCSCSAHWGGLYFRRASIQSIRVGLYLLPRLALDFPFGFQRCALDLVLDLLHGIFLGFGDATGGCLIDARLGGVSLSGPFAGASLLDANALLGRLGVDRGEDARARVAGRGACRRHPWAEQISDRLSERGWLLEKL